MEKRKRTLLSRKKLAIPLGLVAMAIAATAAFAYWTGGGSGSGSAAVGTAGSVVLTGTVTPGSAPGTAEPVSFTAANASASPVQVTTVHLVSIAVDSPHAACKTADFTMADVTEAHQVPAGATAEELPTKGSLVYANTSENQDACKGATLTLTLASS
jgi:hypothetical protein